MDDIRRLPSGIPGLDRNIEEGFPNPMILLLEGEPGTGKSTFALQMLMHECEGMNRIYFSGISEPFESMVRNMGRHKFFRADYIEQGVVNFIDIGQAMGMGAEARLTPTRESELELGEPFTTIIRKIRELQPDMVVIDPLLTSFSAESLKYRKIIYDFFRIIRDLGVFMLIVKENTAHFHAHQFGNPLRQLGVQLFYVCKVAKGFGNLMQTREFFYTALRFLIEPCILDGYSRLISESHD